jgi:hypothetical protein
MKPKETCKLIHNDAVKKIELQSITKGGDDQGTNPFSVRGRQTDIESSFVSNDNYWFFPTKYAA